MGTPSWWGGITLGAAGGVLAALCHLQSLCLCVASSSSLGGALSLYLSAAGSERSGKQGGINAAQGLASYWEGAEAWQTCCMEAAGWGCLVETRTTAPLPPLCLGLLCSYLGCHVGLPRCSKGLVHC